jgi:hypothetical protein
MTTSPKRKCSALTKAGTPCRAWAVPGTDPPLCAAHNGKPGGPPPGNTNALTHGLYAAGQPCEVPPAGWGQSIDDVIQDLAAKQARLSAYIDTLLDGRGEARPRPEDVTRLMALHAQTASRLGRLLRDRAALSGSRDADLQAGIDAALDDLGRELGIDL